MSADTLPSALHQGDHVRIVDVKARDMLKLIGAVGRVRWDSHRRVRYIEVGNDTRRLELHGPDAVIVKKTPAPPSRPVGRPRKPEPPPGPSALDQIGDDYRRALARLRGRASTLCGDDALTEWALEHDIAPADCRRIEDTGEGQHRVVQP